MGVALAVGAAVVVGFFAGLLAFNLRSRWCPDCGSWTYAFKPSSAKRVEPQWASKRAGGTARSDRATDIQGSTRAFPR